MHSIDHNDSLFLVCPSKRHDRFSKLLTHDIVETSHFSKSPSDHHILPLHGCNNKEGEPNGFQCDACRFTKIGTTYYLCSKGCGPYHKECVESPLEINVPHHPKHPLKLVRRPSYYYRNSSFSLKSSCCGNNKEGLFYYCSVCDFSMDPVCVRKPALLSIYHPKCHEHTLMYLQRKASLACNVCGSDHERHFIYICLQCDFIVDKTCIYTPRVIMIARHNHRLSFSPSLLSSDKWLCGVCHVKINESYGEYICVKGCAFAVHSKCATHEEVWDGRELEDEPEDDEYENTKPFEDLGDGTIIRHFSHQHHPLRLFEKIDDENTYCKACMLPLYDENIYKCEEYCDFILHQTCANLPLRKQHLVHMHPLILKAEDHGNYYQCKACYRDFFGFTYVCSKGCDDFNIDTRCSMVSEPVDHLCHPHPLFLRSEMGSFHSSCKLCFGVDNYLDCFDCGFTACFRCATLPHKVKYKHDDHFLMLSSVSRVENGNTIYWCEICGERIYTRLLRLLMYACNICCITLHVDCAIERDMYKEPGQSFKSIEDIKDQRFRSIEKIKGHVLLNTSLTRPRCYNCGCHCKYKLLFKAFVKTGVVIFCSWNCVKFCSSELLVVETKL